MKKQKLTFKPVMTRRIGLAENKAFETALAVSNRFVIIETPTTITFRFRKRRTAEDAMKSRRGFASMDPKKRSEIAQLGGRAAHEKGTAHQFKSGKEARDAGRKGGQTSRGGRGRLIEE